MLGIANPMGYVTIALLLVLTPGPATVYILSRGYQRGLVAGFVALAGCTAGDVCLMAMAALGVAGLVHAYPLLFDVVRWTGAAYLIWLGLKALWPKRQDRQVSIGMDAGTGATIDAAAITQLQNAGANRSLGRIFIAGFGVILINPKAVLFFMAFFPLFVDPVNNRGALTFIALGAIFISMNVCYLGSVMVIGRLMRRRFAGNKELTLWLSRLTGLAFIGFGVKLAASSLR